ncbi:MAG: penicillin-binding protein 2 [Streptosporangiales bacterium]|nr:penicillin-binding protein 2 [Streptosporangiales bacterium]
MNKPLRRLSIAILALFALLLANANYVQVINASNLREKPGNSRTLMDSYARERGDIVAGEQAIATSVRTDDAYKYRRIYKNGPMYAPATGFYGLYNATGIERAENSMLSGEDDRLFVRRTIDLFQGRKPRGATVQLTLRPRAQRAAYQALKGYQGAVIALDPKTGAILAMATSPSYNPNKLTGHDTDEVNRVQKRLAKNDNAPLVNRPLQGRYPPGSTFKLVTAAAALSSGKYSPDTMVPSPTQYQLPNTQTPLNNFGGEICGDGQQSSLEDALTISCNTAFAKLGVKLGDDAVRQQAERFGFGDSFEVPMPAEQSVFPEDPDKAQTALSAVGQYEVAATPLQMAMVSSAIANDGDLTEPHVVDEVRAQNLKTIESADPQSHGRAVSPEVARQLTKMMESVVESGTGTSAQMSGTKVAGKTGTAQHGTGQPPHAWFTGFAPADNPQVAVAVVVEDGGSMGSEATGGQIAAPIARSVMQSVINQ